MEDIYGWRAKIGLIYPAPGWVMEPEYYAMAPKGVATYTTRISLENCSIEGLGEIGNRSVEAARLLSEAPLDVIALGCTSGSFIQGYGYDQEIIKRMEQVTNGIPCTTTASAVVAAIKYLNIKKVAVATPYVDDVNNRAKHFLQANGLEVVNMKGLGFIYDIDIDSQSLEAVYKLAKNVNTEDAEAVLILCTGLRTVPILKALENDLEKTVISAIQATFWHCLYLAGVNTEIKGYGRLLSCNRKDNKDDN